MEGELSCWSIDRNKVMELYLVIGSRQSVDIPEVDIKFEELNIALKVPNGIDSKDLAQRLNAAASYLNSGMKPTPLYQSVVDSIKK